MKGVERHSFPADLIIGRVRHIIIGNHPYLTMPKEYHGNWFKLNNEGWALQDLIRTRFGVGIGETYLREIKRYELH